METPTEKADLAMRQLKDLFDGVDHIGKVAAKMLVKRLDEAYASTHFGRDDLNPFVYLATGFTSIHVNLEQADVCKALRDHVARQYGLQQVTHEELGRRYNAPQRTRPERVRGGE